MLGIEEESKEEAVKEEEVVEEVVEDSKTEELSETNTETKDALVQAIGVLENLVQEFASIKEEFNTLKTAKEEAVAKEQNKAKKRELTLGGTAVKEMYEEPETLTEKYMPSVDYYLNKFGTHAAAGLSTAVGDIVSGKILNFKFLADQSKFYGWNQRSGLDGHISDQISVKMNDHTPILGKV